MPQKKNGEGVGPRRFVKRTTQETPPGITLYPKKQNKNSHIKYTHSIMKTLRKKI